MVYVLLDLQWNVLYKPNENSISTMFIFKFKNLFISTKAFAANCSQAISCRILEVTTFPVDLSLSTRGPYSENELPLIRINQFITKRKVLSIIFITEKKVLLSQIWFYIDKCK